MKIMRLALTAVFWIGLLAATPAATTNYVAQGGQTPASPYTSWTTAASNIQDAIGQATAGDTVLVSNGVYETGGVNGYPAGTVLTNRIAIYKTITVQAFSTNPADTLIKGRWHEGYPGGPTTNKLGTNAVRCVWMTNGSTLIGFTLTNGATLAVTTDDGYGGGVYCQSTNTVVSNCVLTGNAANWVGGGANFGTLYNCTLTANSSVAGYGGGARVSTLYNCTLTSNSAAISGGGSYYGILNNCTLSYNSASSEGGGAYYGTLNNCTLIGNSAMNAGGVRGGTLYNCTLTSNSAPNGSGGGVEGGGTYDATLYNCTLSYNSAMYGGGVSRATLSNCTLSGNSALVANGGGGGARYGTLYNCILTNNSTGNNNGGGGAYYATLYNCTIVNNPANCGGGARGGTLYNCLLIGNSATIVNSYGGGGAFNATLYNCTLSGNSSAATIGGGGVRGGALINCIVYGNSTPSSSASNWLEVVTFANTCTAPAATNGVGNITDNPLFVDTNAANYRLSVYSPPLNAGTNFSWMTDPNVVHSKDLDGSRRIGNFNGQVDMGCYELMLGGTMFIMK